MFEFSALYLCRMSFSAKISSEKMAGGGRGAAKISSEKNGEPQRTFFVFRFMFVDGDFCDL
jgi:hypothetical protein